MCLSIEHQKGRLLQSSQEPFLGKVVLLEGKELDQAEEV